LSVVTCFFVISLPRRTKMKATGVVLSIVCSAARHFEAPRS
jgi:hypothetical protein